MAQKIIHYQHGEVIIRAGKIEQRMYIILEGRVNIVLTDGTNKIVVADLKKGDFFGEMSLFNNSPRSATAVAHGDVKLTYIDNSEQLKLFLLKNPTFAAKMVHILVARLAATNELLIGKVSELNRIKHTNI